MSALRRGSRFAEIFGFRELQSPGYRTALFAHHRFSHLGYKTPTCDGQTDRQTDRHGTVVKRRSGIAIWWTFPVPRSTGSRWVGDHLCG